METKAAESEVVRSSDEFTGKAEMTRTANTRKDLRQLSTSCSTNRLVCDMGGDIHERIVNASSQLDRVARAFEFLAISGFRRTGETLSVADGFEKHSSTLIVMECHGSVCSVGMTPELRIVAEIRSNSVSSTSSSGYEVLSSTNTDSRIQR